MTVTNLPASTRSRAWLYGTLSLVFLRAFPNLRYPLGRDQATYCVIGQGLLHGQLLYRDLWDNKPPGIFYIYALIVKIFGPVMWSVGVVDILWLLAISCCIFYFARRYLGAAGAVLSVIFYAFRHCQQGYVLAGQPEGFLMLGIFIAWFLLLRGGRGSVIWHLAAGLVLGAAFWLKYNAVAFFPLIALVPFLDFRALDQGSIRLRLEISWKDWTLRMAAAGAGFLLTVVAVLAYFWRSGAWPAMKEVQFEVLPRYGAMAFHWSFLFVKWALWQTQNHLGIWWEGVPALALLLAWRRREVASLAPIFLLALAGYACTAMQGRFHPYYFETCYPFFAMFWGYVSIKTYEVFQQLQRIFARKGWTLARPLLWVVFAAIVISLLPEESVRAVQQYKLMADWWRNPELSYKVYWWQLSLDKLGDQLRVVDYLKAHSTPQDAVYVWGTAPLINFLTQRRNPSRFISNLGLMSAWTPERWRQELVRTLESTRPRYIVVARRDYIETVTFTPWDSEGYLSVYPALADLLNREYQPSVDDGDFEIYRLKQSATKATRVTSEMMTPARKPRWR